MQEKIQYIKGAVYRLRYSTTELVCWPTDIQAGALRMRDPIESVSSDYL